jgi:transposase
MHYIGVDYHKRYSYLVVKDDQGQVKQRGLVSNDKEELGEFLRPYRSGKAALEATRNWGLIYDWLEEMLDEVVLAHPLKTRQLLRLRSRRTR